MTFVGSVIFFSSAAMMALAAAPVPQAFVSPAPFSHVITLILLEFKTSTKLTLDFSLK